MQSFIAGFLRRLARRQALTPFVGAAATYWYKKSNLIYIVVTLQGPGGGGGGGGGIGSGVGGTNGGAGGWSRKVIRADELPLQVLVTVGTNGTGGAAITNGTTGTTTSFGGFFSATGGGAGLHSLGGGGANGTGVGGDENRAHPMEGYPFLSGGGTGAPAEDTAGSSGATGFARVEEFYAF